MLTLALPGENENLFFVCPQGIFGPSSAFVSSTVNYMTARAPRDFIERNSPDALNIYGENYVYHRELSGTVKYCPWVTEFQPMPTASYPLTVDWHGFNVTNNYPEDIRNNFGLIQDRMTDFASSPSSNRYWRVLASDSFVFMEVVGSASYPGKIYQINIKQYSALKVSSDGKSITSSLRTYSSYFLADPNNWMVEQSPDILEATYMKYSSKVGSPTTYSSKVYKTRAKYVANVSDVVTKLDNMLLVELFDPVLFPLGWKDEGDLAMEASAKVNRNQVNMIAFLRDLRHPMEMVPKLKNLTNLKGLSDNYLTVEYGILPTIDDFKSIHEACKRIKPFLDKNGYKTYTAGFSDSLNTGTIKYTTEQHIKLAIDDDDVELIHLVNQIDSMGFLPTLENIWDLVPYSFVLDWFIGVGNLLERVDSRLRLARLNIRYVTSSRKATAETEISPTSAFPYSGTIKLVEYRRGVSSQCPLPALSLQTTYQEFSHWLESGALLVQRTKH